MAFAVVHDVAASWEDYGRVERAMAASPRAGLIVHAAGSTDEGFRTIDVWDSEDAWCRFRADRLHHALDGVLAPPLVRELQVRHLVGPGLAAPSAAETNGPRR